MKIIFLDTFTNSIAVGCSEEECVIDYFSSKELALKAYPNAKVDGDLDTMKISVSDITITIVVSNQNLILTKSQAIELRNSLNSL